MKIMPQDIPELSYIGSIMYGVDLYLVDESMEPMRYNGMNLVMCKGQVALRNMLNVNYRIRENPWCVLKNDLDPTSVMFGKLSLLAIWSWNHYSRIPKIVAFKDGKLIAMKHSSNTNPEFIWWDRMNFPYVGCPVSVDGHIVEVDDERNVVI